MPSSAEVAAGLVATDPITAAEAIALVAEIAMLRLDGEGPAGDGLEQWPWVMSDDYAYENLNRVVAEARAVMGWQAGRPPLHTEEYLPRQAEDDGDDL